MPAPLVPSANVGWAVPTENTRTDVNPVVGTAHPTCWRLAA